MICVISDGNTKMNSGLRMNPLEFYSGSQNILLLFFALFMTQFTEGINKISSSEE